jgi:CRP-like cAMP-binding protein
MNHYKCHFAKKDERVYRIGTIGHSIFFLVSGKAHTIISTSIARRNWVPAGYKGHGFHNTENHLTGKIQHEPGAVFGDCAAILGMEKEETLVADTNCLFMVLDTFSVNKCCSPIESVLLTAFVNKKLNKMRSHYIDFLAKQHSDFNRFKKIIGNTFNTVVVEGPRHNGPSRLGKVHSQMKKNLVSKMGIKVHNSDGDKGSGYCDTDRTKIGHKDSGDTQLKITKHQSNHISRASPRLPEFASSYLQKTNSIQISREPTPNDFNKSKLSQK